MKKLLHIAILSLIVLCFSGCWGWGWLVPYSFQPSYHKFKKMCKVNELPNNEEKYNKILSYFDTDLDNLESDWGKLIDEEWEISNKVNYYKKGFFEYAAATKRKWVNYRTSTVATFYINESKINRYNINAMSIDFYWHPKRYVLEQESMASYKFIWRDNTLSCWDIVIRHNMTPQGIDNDK